MLVKKMVMNLESHDTIRKQKITSGNLKSKKSNGFSQDFALPSCRFLPTKHQQPNTPKGDPNHIDASCRWIWC